MPDTQNSVRYGLKLRIPRKFQKEKSLSVLIYKKCLYHSLSHSICRLVPATVCYAPTHKHTYSYCIVLLTGQFVDWGMKMHGMWSLPYKNTWSTELKRRRKHSTCVIDREALTLMRTVMFEVAAYDLCKEDLKTNLRVDDGCPRLLSFTGSVACVSYGPNAF